MNHCNNPQSKPPRGYNDGTIVRYNISVNETNRVIGFDGPVTNTRICNNTILIGPGPAPQIAVFDKSVKSSGYAGRVRFWNNIIVNAGGGAYDWGGATGYKFEANCFAGKRPPNEPPDEQKITADPMIEPAPGFRLRPGSPCAANGIPVADNGGRDYAGTPLPAAAADRGAVQTPGRR